MRRDSQLSPLCSGRLEPEADPDKQANTAWAPGDPSRKESRGPKTRCGAGGFPPTDTTSAAPTPKPGVRGGLGESGVGRASEEGVRAQEGGGPVRVLALGSPKK